MGHKDGGFVKVKIGCLFIHTNLQLHDAVSTSAIKS